MAASGMATSASAARDPQAMQRFGLKRFPEIVNVTRWRADASDRWAGAFWYYGNARSETACKSDYVDFSKATHFAETQR